MGCSSRSSISSDTALPGHVAMVSATTACCTRCALASSCCSPTMTMSAQRMPTASEFQSTGVPVSPRNIARLRGPDCTRGVSVEPGSGAQYQKGSS
jgi:hypothetical protein